jgi:hypothetical protein
MIAMKRTLSANPRPLVRPLWLSLAGLCLLALPTGPLQAVSDKTTKTKATTSADLERVPRNAPIFVSLRVSELWKHKTVQDFIQRLGKKEPRALREIEAAAGVPPAEVERVTVVADAGAEEAAVLVATKKPFAKKQVLKTLLRDWSEAKHQGKTYYRGKRNTALFAVNNRLFVTGTEKLVQRLMTPAATGKTAQPLDNLLLAAEKKAVVMGVDVNSALKAIKKGNGVQLPAALEPLLTAESSWLTATGDKTTRVTWKLRFAKADMAKGERAVRGSLDLAKEGIAMLKKQLAMARGFGGDFEQWAMRQVDLRLTQAEAMLKGAKVNKQGQTITVSAVLKDGDALLLPFMGLGMALPVRAIGAGGAGGPGKALPPPPVKR